MTADSVLDQQDDQTPQQPEPLPDQNADVSNSLIGSEEPAPVQAPGDPEDNISTPAPAVPSQTPATPSPKDAAPQNWDDFMAGGNSWDKFMSGGGESAGKQFMGDAAYLAVHPVQAVQELSDLQRGYFRMQQDSYVGVGKLLTDFGLNYYREMGNATDLSPEMEKSLVDAGETKDFAQGQDAIHKSFMDAKVIPALDKLNALMAREVAVPLVYTGMKTGQAVLSFIPEAFAAAGDTLQDYGFEKTGKMIGDLPDNAMTAIAAQPELEGLAEFLHDAPRLGPLGKTYTEAKASGLFEGLPVFTHEVEATAEQADSMRAAQAQLPIEQAPLGTKENPIPSVQAPPDINEHVRQQNPDLFNTYDRIVQKQTFLEGLYRQLGEQRGDASPFAADIADTQARLEGANARFTKIYTARLADLQEKQADWLKDNNQATPEMEGVLMALDDVKGQRAVFAPEVRAAYKGAADQFPETPQESPAAAPIEAQAHEAPAAPPEQATADPEAPQAQETRSPDEQQAFIARDIQQRAVAAGYDQEQANASAAVLARQYQFMADYYSGSKGTAEDWYNRERPDVAAGKATTKNGAYRPANGIAEFAQNAVASARGTIKIFKSANASTMIHEGAHHFMDMLRRYAAMDDAPKALKDDMDMLHEWLGVKDGDWEALSNRNRIRAEEKFARGSERFMMEGVAPTPKMAGIFAKFKGWLTSIYGSLENIPHQYGGINDNIRNFFARSMGGEGHVIAPDHEPGKMMADIHEADARTTPEGDAAHEAGNQVENELKLSAENSDDAPGTIAAAESEPGAQDRTGAGQIGAGASNTAPPSSPQIGKGAGQAADQGSSIPKSRSRDSIYRPVPKRPPSLLNFIHRTGGIKDEGGDFLATIGGEHKNRPGLIRDKGRSYDDVGKSAHAAGYFNERPDKNGLIDAMTKDFSGNKQYSIHDRAAVEAHHEALAYNEQLDETLQKYNIDTTGKTPSEIYAALSEHMSLEDQGKLESETEVAYREAEAAERERDENSSHLPEPERDNARTEQDLENERQQEISASNAPELHSVNGQPGSESPPTSQESLQRDGNANGPSGRTEEAGRTGQSGTDTAPGSDARDTGTAARSAGRDAGSTDRAVDKAGNIRLENLTSHEDVKQSLRDAAAEHPDLFNHDVVTDQEFNSLVDSLGGGNVRGKGDRGEFQNLNIQRLREISIQDGIPLDVRVRLGRQYLDEATQNVIDIAAKMTGTDKELMDLAEARDKRLMIAETISATTNMWGRTGRAFRDISGNELANPREFTELFQSMTGMTPEQMQKMAKEINNLRVADQRKFTIRTAKFIRDSAQPNFSDKLLYYRDNCLLSGPITHMHYVEGGIINSLYKPATVALASVGGNVKLGEAGAMYAAMVPGAVNGIRVAGEILRKGADADVPLHLQRGKFTTLKNGRIIFTPHQIASPLSPTMDRLFGQPMKLMNAVHAFQKSIRYQQELSRVAYQTAMSEGLEEGSSSFVNRVVDISNDPSADIVEKASKQADIEGYMGPLPKGLGGAVGAVNSSVVGRFLFPFAKMEMNIKKVALVDNTALGFLSKSVWENLKSEDKGVRDLQLAKMSMGTAVAGAAYYLGPNLNGNGPADYKKYQVWRLTHTPNSLQFGEIAIPLRALGTPGQILGAAAELRDGLVEGGGDIAEGDVNKGVGAFMEHAGQAAMEGTFLQQMGTVLDLSKNFEQESGNFFRQFATQFIPYSTGLGQVNRYIDPFKRDTHSEGMKNLYGLTDAIKDKTSPFSETLPEKYDVFGQPIANDKNLEAGSFTQYQNDPVVKAMNRLNIGMTMPKRQIAKVDLTNAEYEEYSKVAGRYAHQQLSNMVQYRGFASAPKDVQIKQINDTIASARHDMAQYMYAHSPSLPRRILAQHSRH